MSNRQFQVLLADTHEGLRLHYMIRYRVFCVETKYEDASVFPDKMETDQYDPHSVHFLVKMEGTGHWVAAMRLVLGFADTLPLSEKTRFERQDGPAPGERTAEVSRLCVVGTLRRRKQEQATPHVVPWGRTQVDALSSGGVLHRLERRRESEILLRLISAATEYGREHHIRYYYAFMASSLMRILKKMGLRIIPIGPASVHRGPRWPCLIDLGNLFLGNALENSEMLEIFQGGAAYMRYSEWKQSVLSKQAAPRELMRQRG